ncbi:MAG: hypothetical protein ABFD16_12325 [Thermoguttaceae bacterium]|jgi:hypothetical protein
MHLVFLVCAVVGGTVLLCQLVMTLLGLAGHAMDFDVSGDIGNDFSGDFHGDTGDLHGGDVGAHHGDTAGDDSQHALAAGHLSAEWLFSVITFRTVVAALTFFGLAGLATQSAGASTPTVLLVAIASGAAAMYSVYWIMQSLYRLRTDGTVRVDRAIGKPATVYLTIPGHNAGAGKVQINLQNRTMEYCATTAGDTLPSGAKVVVVNVVAANTLEVQPALEPERIEHAS